MTAQEEIKTLRRALARILLGGAQGKANGNPYTRPGVSEGYVALGIERRVQVDTVTPLYVIGEVPRECAYCHIAVAVDAYLCEACEAGRVVDEIRRRSVLSFEVQDRGIGREADTRRITPRTATMYFAREGGLREKSAPVEFICAPDGDTSLKQVACYAADGTHLGNIGLSNGKWDIVG